MTDIQYKKYEKLLITGLVFAAITVIGGELPIGWAVYPENLDSLTALILGSGNLSVAQLACGVFFGGIGIPMQYFGYKAISGIIGLNGNEKYCRIIDVGAAAIAFGGGTVHVLCVALMYVVSIVEYGIYSWLPPQVMEFTLFLVLPFSAVFMLFYLPMTIAMFIPVVKKKTILPVWACMFNPIIYKAVLNIFVFIAPNRPWANAIRMSNMGIGSLITFTGILYIIRKQNTK